MAHGPYGPSKKPNFFNLLIEPLSFISKIDENQKKK